ncbi:MAG: hypothetical protein OSJ45_12285 [Lachnospiraceae bacterium]|nr:hypothetical protein [Lachnospiraceae bacterium]
MKKCIESYHMFFPDRIFSILLYIVYPLIVWGILFIENIFVNNSYIILLTAPALVLFIECMADLFVFAGYAKKDSGRNEYLKTSVRYMQMLKRAFVSDIIRRILSILFIIFIVSSVLKAPFNISIFAAISVNFFITAALCILRFFDFFTAYYFITSIILLLYVVFCIIVFIRNLFILASIIMAVLSIFLILFHTSILFKAIKEGYYD